MADQISRPRRCAVQLIDASPRPPPASLQLPQQAEQRPTRAETGAVRAKELVLQLERLVADSNPFGASRGRSSGGSESAANSTRSLSPISTAQSARCAESGDDGATSESRGIRRCKAVAGAGDDGVRKGADGGSGSRGRRRKKGGRGKKGKRKAEMCPCGCARMVPADALAEQQREVQHRKTQSQPLNPPASARLFGQRSATATCPVESPFLDSLVRSLAFEASNDDVEVDPTVTEAGKSPLVVCLASDGFCDNNGRASAAAPCDTNEGGNQGNSADSVCRGVAATELTVAAKVSERKVDLCGADKERQTTEEQQEGSDCNCKRRDDSQRRNEKEATSQPGSLRPETPSKTRHFDRSMAVARWILSPVNPYSSARRRSSSHNRTLEDTRSSSSARSEPVTRPSSSRTKSVSARRDLSGSFGGSGSQPADVRGFVSEPASLVHSARTDASTSKSSHNQTSTASSSRCDNKDTPNGATNVVENTHRIDSRGHSKPPMWRWLHLLSSNMGSQLPHTSQPRLVS